MNLREYEGKELFAKHGIAAPAHALVAKTDIRAARTRAKPPFMPCVLKAQMLSGDRMAHGGIVIVESADKFLPALAGLFERALHGEAVERVLIEERIPATAEYYVSVSYDTDARAPVLSLATKGGSGVAAAQSFPIDLTVGLPSFMIRDALMRAGFPRDELANLAGVVAQLYTLFVTEYALLAEINPLMKTADGRFVAGDAKIILDDEKIKPGERRFIEMQGDIAILASGGGASLLNIDTLLEAGGKPANYTEYSGNPPAEVVEALTQRVMGRPGLKGCWVIGGTANFTDIYETLRGFVEGLRNVTPKPTYPIVIRRDGPRKDEAFKMLAEAGAKEGFDFHCYDSGTPMSETAKIIVCLAYRA